MQRKRENDEGDEDKHLMGLIFRCFNVIGFICILMSNYYVKDNAY